MYIMMVAHELSTIEVIDIAPIGWYTLSVPLPLSTRIMMQSPRIDNLQWRNMMAKTTQSAKHTHKYYRIETTGLWHCVNCTHFMPGNMPPPVGRTSLCWSCDNPFQLTPYNMREDKPVCDACEEHREVFDIDKYMAEQLKKRRQEKEDKTYDVEADDPQLPDHSLEHSGECASWLGLDCDCKS